MYKNHTEYDTIIMSSYYNTNSASTTAPPAEAPADMENGLESGAVALAQRFYEDYHDDIIHITDRLALGRYFASVQEKIFEDDNLPTTEGGGGGELTAVCTANGRTDRRRHFRQVLYALRVHGKVLRVYKNGSYIDWYETSNARAGSEPPLSIQQKRMASMYGRLSPDLRRLFEVMVSDALEKMDIPAPGCAIIYVNKNGRLNHWMKTFLSQWAEMPERVLEQRLSVFGASGDQSSPSSCHPFDPTAAALVDELFESSTGSSDGGDQSSPSEAILDS